jgi:hypothetical protein
LDPEAGGCAVQFLRAMRVRRRERKKSLAGGGGLAFEHLSNTYSGIDTVLSLQSVTGGSGANNSVAGASTPEGRQRVDRSVHPNRGCNHSSTWRSLIDGAVAAVETKPTGSHTRGRRPQPFPRDSCVVGMGSTLAAPSSAIIRISEHFHVFSPPPRLSARMFGSGGKKRANASSN